MFIAALLKNSQDREATWMSTNRWMIKKMWHIYIYIYGGHDLKTEQQQQEQQRRKSSYLWQHE